MYRSNCAFGGFAEVLFRGHCRVKNQKNRIIIVLFLSMNVMNRSEEMDLKQAVNLIDLI